MAYLTSTKNVHPNCGKFVSSKVWVKHLGISQSDLSQKTSHWFLKGSPVLLNLPHGLIIVITNCLILIQWWRIEIKLWVITIFFKSGGLREQTRIMQTKLHRAKMCYCVWHQPLHLHLAIIKWNFLPMIWLFTAKKQSHLSCHIIANEVTQTTL